MIKKCDCYPCKDEPICLNLVLYKIKFTGSSQGVTLIGEERVVLAKNVNEASEKFDEWIYHFQSKSDRLILSDISITAICETQEIIS